MSSSTRLPLLLLGIMHFTNSSGVSEAPGSSMVAVFHDGCDSRLTNMRRGGSVCLTVHVSSTQPTEAVALPQVSTAADDIAEAAAAASSRCLFVGRAAGTTSAAESRRCDWPCLESRPWPSNSQLRSHRGEIGAEPPTVHLVAITARTPSGFLLLPRRWRQQQQISDHASEPLTFGCSLTCSGVATWWSNSSYSVLDRRAEVEFSKRGDRLQGASQLRQSHVYSSAPAETSIARTPLVATMAISSCSASAAPQGSGVRPAVAAASAERARDKADKAEHKGIGGNTSPSVINRITPFSRRRRDDRVGDIIIDRAKRMPADAATSGDEGVTEPLSLQKPGKTHTAELFPASPTASDGRTMQSGDVILVTAAVDDRLWPTSEFPSSTTAAVFTVHSTSGSGIAYVTSATESGWSQTGASVVTTISSSTAAQATPSSAQGATSPADGELNEDSPGTSSSLTTSAVTSSTLQSDVADPVTVGLSSDATSPLRDAATFSVDGNATRVDRYTNKATDRDSGDTWPPFSSSGSSVTLRYTTRDDVTLQDATNVSTSDRHYSTAADEGGSEVPLSPSTDTSTSASLATSYTMLRYTTDNSQSTTRTTDDGKRHVTGSDEGRNTGPDIEAIAAGVTVTAVVLLGCGVGAYMWYRKKYPVRMPIGRKFVTHFNPEYKVPPTPTVTLVKDEV